MKCVIVVGLLVTLLGHGFGSVLKCSLDRKDACIDKEEKAPPPPSEMPEEAARQTECLAGSEWESNCHYCRCADSGVAECLKQEACDDGVFSEPIQCKPNTTFQRNCNTCVCLESGLALCTVEYCRRSAVPDKPALPAGKECAPGSTWRSRCNDCTCTPSGYAACTEIACPEEENKPEIRCAPDTAWKNDCNTCWCNGQGRAVCTKVGCATFNVADIDSAEDQEFVNGPNSSLVRTVRAVQEAPYKACQPGQEFRLDCNKCLCDNSGQDFSCTRIDCNAPTNGVRTKRGASNLEEVTADCTPGSTYEQGCNACKCTADGHHALCTNKKCAQEGQEKQPATDVRSSDAADPGFRCNPGEQFKKDCNDCTCSADGRSTFCTLRLCDQDITPGI
ncbi:hypothetical protein ABMA28_009148 [Loxostege sticticalis]|uniref:Pacifastin domain-containing protein n=1 Tax=Loxostege sticticalis TaxID=481309 RepID=A0ABD0SCC5_LOXSC